MWTVHVQVHVPQHSLLRADSNVQSCAARNSVTNTSFFCLHHFFPAQPTLLASTRRTTRPYAYHLKVVTALPVKLAGVAHTQRSRPIQFSHLEDQNVPCLRNCRGLERASERSGWTDHLSEMQWRSLPLSKEVHSGPSPTFVQPLRTSDRLTMSEVPTSS